MTPDLLLNRGKCYTLSSFKTHFLSVWLCFEVPRHSKIKAVPIKKQVVADDLTLSILVYQSAFVSLK